MPVAPIAPRSLIQLPEPKEAVSLSVRGMGAKQINNKLIMVEGIPNVVFVTAPRLRLNVGGNDLTVTLGANMSPEQVRDAVAAAVNQLNPLLSPPAPGVPMPRVDRYEVYSQRLANGQIMLGVTHGSHDVDQISEKFERATHTKAGRPSLVSRREIADIFKAADGNGMFSDEEKQAIAYGWASLFTGAGFQATAAAQKYYAEASKRYELPDVPVM